MSDISDPNQIVWKRCLDMNDRVLRNVVVGLGKKADGVVREDHFVVVVFPSPAGVGLIAVTKINFPFG